MYTEVEMYTEQPIGCFVLSQRLKRASSTSSRATNRHTPRDEAGQTREYSQRVGESIGFSELGAPASSSSRMENHSRLGQRQLLRTQDSVPGLPREAGCPSTDLRVQLKDNTCPACTGSPGGGMLEVECMDIHCRNVVHQL